MARRGRRGRVAGLTAGLFLGLVASACGVGSWTQPSYPAPVRAVHAALLPTGKVLLAEGSGNDASSFAAGTFKTTVWDPGAGTAPGAFHDVATPWDVFCSGHAFLPDGRLLVAGGTTGYPNSTTGVGFKGSKQTYVFDPTSETYQPAPSMAVGRWYPTLVELGDSRIVSVSGTNENGNLSNTFEVFQTNGTWTPSSPLPNGRYFPTYPALHLLADGRLFFSGESTGGIGNQPPGIWDLAAQTFTPVTGLPDPQHRDQGASVLLPPAQDQRVMVMGGGNTDGSAATASTAVIDLKQPSPQFVAAPPLEAGKMYVSAVILPDGTVLETGGTDRHWLGDHPQYVRSARIFDPTTNQWTTASAPTVGRTYHSEALLLPDGRVATFGGNPAGSPFETRIEIYSPGYIGKPRPVIVAAPSELTRGAAFDVTTSGPVSTVELVHPAAVTHSLDPDQRLVTLPFTAATGGVHVTLDSSPNLAPPGWYLLFVVDANRVPSVAKWVHLT